MNIEAHCAILMVHYTLGCNVSPPTALCSHCCDLNGQAAMFRRIFDETLLADVGVIQLALYMPVIPQFADIGTRLYERLCANHLEYMIAMEIDAQYAAVGLDCYKFAVRDRLISRDAAAIRSLYDRIGRSVTESFETDMNDDADADAAANASAIDDVEVMRLILGVFASMNVRMPPPAYARFLADYIILLPYDGESYIIHTIDRYSSNITVIQILLATLSAHMRTATARVWLIMCYKIYSHLCTRTPCCISAANHIHVKQFGEELARVMKHTSTVQCIEMLFHNNHKSC